MKTLKDKRLWNRILEPLTLILLGYFNLMPILDRPKRHL